MKGEWERYGQIQEDKEVINEQQGESFEEKMRKKRKKRR